MSQHQTIMTGNAKEDCKETRGWFVGAFIDEKFGLRHSPDVEVKWGEHPQGEEGVSKAGEGDATTLSILLKGKYGITMEGQTEIILEKEGDYLMFNPNIPHSRRAYEDSLIITVRWPSLSATKN